MLYISGIILSTKCALKYLFILGKYEKELLFQRPTSSRFFLSELKVKKRANFVLMQS